MATPQQRRKARSGTHSIRKKSKSLKKKPQIKGFKIITDNWDSTKTPRQNYERLGLATSLNGVAGGLEKPIAPSRSANSDSEEDDDDEEIETPKEEMKELTEEEIEKVKKTLKPGEGLIQRDDDGNVIRVIVGEKKTLDEILDEEPVHVEAKTDVVRELERMSKLGVARKRHISKGELTWIQKLVAKHGDNYKAMFFDEDLNPYQQTEAQLRRKCLQLQK